MPNIGEGRVSLYRGFRSAYTTAYANAPRFVQERLGVNASSLQAGRPMVNYRNFVELHALSSWASMLRGGSPSEASNSTSRQDLIPFIAGGVFSEGLAALSVNLDKSGQKRKYILANGEIFEGWLAPGEEPRVDGFIERVQTMIPRAVSAEEAKRVSNNVEGVDYTKVGAAIEVFTAPKGLLVNEAEDALISGGFTIYVINKSVEGSIEENSGYGFVVVKPSVSGRRAPTYKLAA